ncbi:BioY protein [Salinarchaeum sp. Harcht-Bsk1]|uniref:biotin transporter BioY n=1 Tax=Salinarchaeum sp. Harcht-Bsk1 TaxID=1333523 RepID=UPI00034231B9|nr:biotin transporter BioY [Salinarchaeum sp. Harcht-Bsk1]AGN02112.1 BioY protein [Salinarchaeum sp. Harcht-Bsk1]
MSSGVTTVARDSLRRSAAAGGYLHRVRTEADLLERLLLVGGFAALTGLAAQVRIPLWFTPVPITLQTFAFLLAGLVLGARFGGLSQGLYVGAGVAGVPWFQAMGAGVGHLAGPTGGYLVGMFCSTLLVGYVVDRYPVREHLSALIGLLAVANALVYVVGLPWLFAWSNLVTGGDVGLWELLVIGLFPFVAGDVVKLLGAVAVGRLLAPPASRYDDAGEPIAAD